MDPAFSKMPVVLVGCDPDILPEIRPELQQLGLTVAHEEHSLNSLLSNWQLSTRQKQIMMVYLKDGQDFDDLKKINMIFPDNPILAFVPSPDANVLTRAMRGGAAQVVTLPLLRHELIEALTCIHTQQVQVVTAKHVIAVAGTSGGAGASTVAMNLAYDIAESHKQHCILVDLSLTMGVLANLLNVEPKISIHYLLQDVERISPYFFQRALIPITPRLQLLPGPDGLVKPTPVATTDLFHVINGLLEMTNIVILDLPATFDENYFEILLNANHAFLIAQQKIPSVRALKLVSDTLHNEGAHGVIHLVINRYDSRVPGFSVEDLQRLLNIPKIHTVTQDSMAVMNSLNTGQPLRKSAPHSPVLRDLSHLVNLILPPNRPPSKIHESGFLGRLFRQKKT